LLAAPTANGVFLIIRYLLIFGDNILECERAAKLIARAIGETEGLTWIDSPLHHPEYRLTSKTEACTFHITLFAGHDRWRYDIRSRLTNEGDTLAENVDALIVEIVPSGTITPVFAVEFCSSLPAGNNAWQRTTRALGASNAGIPFLSFIEIGGAELNALRKAKSARLPNPLVAVAYAVLDARAEASVSYVLTPADSSIEEKMVAFRDVFGETEALAIVNGLLFKGEIARARLTLRSKAIRAAKVLAGARKRKDTLRNGEWDRYVSEAAGLHLVTYLQNIGQKWHKRITIPTRSNDVDKALEIARSSGAVSVGASDFPICLVPANSRLAFVDRLANELKIENPELLKWLNGTGPLALIWILGFKKTKQDARPDRGLPSLAKMLLGTEVDYLSIVYGPPPSSHFSMFDSQDELAATNGLWRSIFFTSGGVLLTPQKGDKNGTVGFVVDAPVHSIGPPPVDRLDDPIMFGEQDVDTVLHQIFSNSLDDGIHECMCNPPGGDWSGANFIDIDSKMLFRYTSLPRVSGKGKRPDHIVFVEGKVETIFAIESKQTVLGKNGLESKIGPRLVLWTKSLLEHAPNLSRGDLPTWSENKRQLPTAKHAQYISGGAAMHMGRLSKKLMEEKQLDVFFGLDFDRKEGRVNVDITVNNPDALAAVNAIYKASKRFNGRIKIDIHCLMDGID